jgi:hypothetical protein
MENLQPSPFGQDRQSGARAPDLASAVRFIYRQSLTAGQSTAGDMLRALMLMPENQSCNQNRGAACEPETASRPQTLKEAVVPLSAAA